ncbi:MAG: hypothetical protein SGPRY_003195 [Prymnesium sp.]
MEAPESFNARVARKVMRARSEKGLRQEAKASSSPSLRPLPPEALKQRVSLKLSRVRAFLSSPALVAPPRRSERHSSRKPLERVIVPDHATLVRTRSSLSRASSSCPSPSTNSLARDSGIHVDQTCSRDSTSQRTQISVRDSGIYVDKSCGLDSVVVVDRSISRETPHSWRSGLYVDQSFSSISGRSADTSCPSSSPIPSVPSHASLRSGLNVNQSRLDHSGHSIDGKVPPCSPNVLFSMPHERGSTSFGSSPRALRAGPVDERDSIPGQTAVTPCPMDEINICLHSGEALAEDVPNCHENFGKHHSDLMGSSPGGANAAPTDGSVGGLASCLADPAQLQSEKCGTAQDKQESLFTFYDKDNIAILSNDASNEWQSKREDPPEWFGQLMKNLDFFSCTSCRTRNNAKQ